MNRAPWVISISAIVISSVLIGASIAIEFFVDPTLVTKTQTRQQQNNQVVNMARQMDQMILNNQSVKGAIAALEKKLESRLKLIEDTCDIGEAQRKRLMLAGHADIQQHMRKYFAIKRRMENEEFDNFNAVWQLGEPLRSKMSGQFFDRFSLFDRALQHNLTQAQQSEFSQRRLELLRFKTETAIHQAVAALDSVAPIKPAERSKLKAVLTGHIEPPLELESRDQLSMATRYVFFRCKSIPEDELRPLLSDDAWALFAQGVKQASAYKHHFQSIGLIEPNQKER